MFGFSELPIINTFRRLVIIIILFGGDNHSLAGTRWLERFEKIVYFRHFELSQPISRSYEALRIFFMHKCSIEFKFSPLKRLYFSILDFAFTFENFLFLQIRCVLIHKKLLFAYPSRRQHGPFLALWWYLRRICVNIGGRISKLRTWGVIFPTEEAERNVEAVDPTVNYKMQHRFYMHIRSCFALEVNGLEAFFSLFSLFTDAPRPLCCCEI